MYILMSRRNKALIRELSTPPPGTKDLYFPTQYSQSTWEQFKSCLWKQWLTYWRSPDYNLVRFFFTLAVAFVVGTVFWRVGKKRFDVATLIEQTSMSEYFVITTVSSVMFLQGKLKRFEHHYRSFIWIYILCWCQQLSNSSTSSGS